MIGRRTTDRIHSSDSPATVYGHSRDLHCQFRGPGCFEEHEIKRCGEAQYPELLMRWLPLVSDDGGEIVTETREDLFLGQHEGIRRIASWVLCGNYIILGHRAIAFCSANAASCTARPSSSKGATGCRNSRRSASDASFMVLKTSSYRPNIEIEFLVLEFISSCDGKCWRLEA